MTHMGEMRNSYNVLIEKSEEKIPLGKRETVLLECIIIRVRDCEWIHVI
jgi:hypothetical protein